jgi:hypothetical protein
VNVSPGNQENQERPLGNEWNENENEKSDDDQISSYMEEKPQKL